MPSYIVQGTYPGAEQWEIQSDESPEELAERLADAYGGDSFIVDGVVYNTNDILPDLL